VEAFNIVGILVLQLLPLVAAIWALTSISAIKSEQREVLRRLADLRIAVDALAARDQQSKDAESQVPVD
jgi:hypothetical protein